MQPQSQTHPRIRKRVPCTLRSAGRAHAGMVLNLSRGGLFVQTGAHVAPGDDVALELNVATADGGIAVGARVVWRRAVAPQLRSVSQGGFGVRIENAPAAYLRFLAEAGQPVPQVRVAAAPGPAASGAAEPVFRVRLKQTNGPRTRWVSVQSTDEAAARSRALREAGDDWAVLECQADSA